MRATGSNFCFSAPSRRGAPLIKSARVVATSLRAVTPIPTARSAWLRPTDSVVSDQQKRVFPLRGGALSERVSGFLPAWGIPIIYRRSLVSKKNVSFSAFVLRILNNMFIFAPDLAHK